MGCPRVRTFLAACSLLACLPACTGSGGGVLGDDLPQAVGGLPTAAPARPTTPYAFPAVHDMPPPRSDVPLTDDQQLKAEKDLEAARDRVEGKNPQAKTPAVQGAKGAKAAKGKKKPADQEAGENTGAKTSP